MKKEKLKKIILEELRVVTEGDKMERLAGRYGGEPDKAIADPGDKDVENPVVMDSEKGGKNRGKGRTAAPRSKHYVNEDKNTQVSRQLGFNGNVVGQKFMWGGKWFKVTGFDLKNERNPILAIGPSGGKRKIDAFTLGYSLSRAKAPVQYKDYVDEGATMSKGLIREAIPRNMTDLASYFIEKEKMGALKSNDARDLFGMYASMVTAGEISEKDAIRRALRDIAAQAKRTKRIKKEAGDPLRQSYKGAGKTDYGTNQPQNRSNFRPGAPSPRTSAPKAPKPKPIKEAKGDIMGEGTRILLNKEVKNLQGLLNMISKRTGRRPRPGQNFLDLDGTFEVLNALWEVEVGAKHLANHVNKVVEKYKRMAND